MFALQHVIPLSWGSYVAVPLALFFAYGVERVKRSTIAIASKHLLKYKTFGFVGIAAALYGAKELPGAQATPQKNPTSFADCSNIVPPCAACSTDNRRGQNGLLAATWMRMMVSAR